jgi:hypothetical protein
MDEEESFKKHITVAWPDVFFIITPNSNTPFHPYRATTSAALCCVDSLKRALKADALMSFETSVAVYQSTSRIKPQDWNIQ